MDFPPSVRRLCKRRGGVWETCAAEALLALHACALLLARAELQQGLHLLHVTNKRLRVGVAETVSSQPVQPALQQNLQPTLPPTAFQTPSMQQAQLQSVPQQPVMVRSRRCFSTCTAVSVCV